VLSALPEPLCQGVYSQFHNEVVFAAAAYYAVELPPALLCTWVRCNAPCINLTGAKLTAQVLRTLIIWLATLVVCTLICHCLQSFCLCMAVG
jgi:hypothetical protein